MSVSIGVVANVYNEVNALPGWLECASQFFDDIRIFHAGPGGQASNDGTLEILEKWRIPVTFGSIDEGFGTVRTKTLRLCPCDWVMLLDADERFYAKHQVMTCAGENTPPDQEGQVFQDYDHRGLDMLLPNWENLIHLGSKLSVSFGEVYNQGAWLRDILEKQPELDAVKTCRRHWHDFSFKRPTQNWHVSPDWQMRLVKNKESIRFSSDTRMHERLEGASNVYHANFTHGPFFDHFHLAFKRMEMEQRRYDVAVYNAIHHGTKPPTFEEFKEMK